MIRSAETPLNTADASSGEKQNAPSCIKFQSVIRTLHGKHRTIIIIIWYPITCLFVFKLKTNCTITHNLYHGQILDWQLCIKQHLDTRQAQLPGALAGLAGAARSCIPAHRSRAEQGWVQCRALFVQGDTLSGPCCSSAEKWFWEGGQEMPYGNRKPKWFMCWGMRGRGDGAALPLFLKALYELIYCQRK